MPKISFRGVHKVFGATVVIEDFTADVPDKEFLVLLGPSGCGKSTMLRMIAGLVDVTDGDILFDDISVLPTEPRDRNVAFVFQSYALYPHMTVRKNIAFPLLMDRFHWWHHLPFVSPIIQNRLLKSGDVREKVENIADTMELKALLDRRPKTLSGGQRQRVALARALVRDPSIYLLDEPLSNLDAKLRSQMRVEITELFHKVGKTFVYVTHDQVEAMTMATRIILMDQGKIQQDGSPQEIYKNPKNTFVARFIGSPPMNLIPVQVSSRVVNLRSDRNFVLDLEAPEFVPEGEVILGVRAEKVSFSMSASSLPGRAAVVEHLGAETIVGFRFDDDDSDAVRPGVDRSLYFGRVAGEAGFTPGQKLGLVMDWAEVCWFDSVTGERLGAVSSALR